MVDCVLYQHKLDEHVANVQDFQAMMSAHCDWLSGAEQTIGAFKYPSKLVDRVLQQIDEHKAGGYFTYFCCVVLIELC